MSKELSRQFKANISPDLNDDRFSLQAVEKWIALVRFRKAVNAHAAEVSRLQNLLQIAQGGEERSRLTSELELVTTRYSLEDMEDALHKEVQYRRSSNSAPEALVYDLSPLRQTQPFVSPQF